MKNGDKQQNTKLKIMRNTDIGNGYVERIAKHIKDQHPQLH